MTQENQIAHIQLAKEAAAVVVAPASAAASARSTALPPFFIAAMAASVAIGSTVATAPCLAAVRGIEVARRATRNFFMPQVSVMMRNVQCWFQLAVYMFP